MRTFLTTTAFCSALFLVGVPIYAQNLGETIQRLKEVKKIRDFTTEGKDGEALPVESKDEESEETDGVRGDSPGVFSEELDVGEDISERTSVQDILGPPDVYHYAGFGKRDPFMPPEDLSAVIDSNSPNGYEIPIVSPLQKPLSNLTVGGIWELKDGGKRALVLVEPGSEGIIAKTGDPIGLAGKIVGISTQGVLVREYNIREDGSRDFTDKLLGFGTPVTDKLAGDKIVLKPGAQPKVEKKPEDIERVQTKSNTFTPTQEQVRAHQTKTLLDRMQAFRNKIKEAPTQPASSQIGLQEGQKK